MIRNRLIGALALLVFSPWAGASGMALALKAGTLGAGVELTTGVTDSINARFGINNFTYGTSGTEAGISYDIDMQLQSGSVLFDWHPLGFGLRATGGLLYNNNELSMRGQSTTGYTVGGTTYNAAEVATLSGTVDFDNLTPYLGVGWGNAVAQDQTFTVSFDLGILFQGAPNASLGATGTLASDPTFLANLRSEETDLNNSLDNFEYYPVVALGLGMHF